MTDLFDELNAVLPEDVKDAAKGWRALSLNQLVDPDLLAEISSASDQLMAFLAVARGFITQAQLAQKNLTVTIPDVLQVAVKAIADILEGFLQLGKIHALFVPMSKIIPDQDDPLIPISLDALKEAYNADFDETKTVLTSGANTALADLHGKAGGNSGFYRTFASSLMDIYDNNRPQYFDRNDVVVMSVILTGAPTFAQIAESAASFNRLFRPKGNEDLTARTIPIPQGVAVKVIGAPGTSRLAVRVEWERPKPIISTPYIPRVGIVVQRYAIIRSTDPKILSATNILDLFPTRNLTVGLTRGGHKVIAIGTGINASYVDSDETLNDTTAYYYAVAWEVLINEAGTKTLMLFNDLSNVAKTRVKAASPSQKSAPPDWYSYKNALDVIPSFAATMRRFVEELRVLTDRVNGAAALMDQGLALAAENFDALVRRIASLNEDLLRLAGILAQQLPGLYATTMYGKGGNAYLMAELAARLNDPTDPNRPPYDSGQYVIGACFVAGGPRLPDIQPIIDLFETMFGDAAPSNPLLGVLTSLDGILLEEESAVLGSDHMGQDLRHTTETVDPLTGLPLNEPLPVVADDGTAVPSLDPKNPEMGFTGLLNIEDLC